MTEFASRQSATQGGQTPLVRLRDAPRTLDMLFCGALAWGLPERYWESFLRMYAHYVTRGNKARTAKHIRLLKQMFGSRFDSARRLNIVYNREYHATRTIFYRMRENAPYRWAPIIHVDGYQHIEEALSYGRGAILWDGRFAYGSVVTKKGLGRLGVRPHHLSRPSHVDMGSLYARKVLSPIFLRVETRNLTERIVLSANSALASSHDVATLMALLQQLRANEVVSITVGQRAMQTITIPLFGCRIKLATGPISLALSSGAPLLPIFTVRNAAGEYKVTIERPLDLAGGGDHRAKIEAAAHDYATRLAPYALEYVDQYDLFRESAVEPIEDGKPHGTPSEGTPEETEPSQGVAAESEPAGGEPETGEPTEVRNPKRQNCPG